MRPLILALPLLFAAPSSHGAPPRLAPIVPVTQSAVAPERRAAERTELKAAIDEVFKTAAYNGARVGAKVVSLDDGSTLYERNADDLLNPASNVKLFSSAAALARLGSDYRFTTDFLVDKGARERGGNVLGAAGEVRGNLYVVGRGDPTITTEVLYGLALQLRYHGLRSVSGDLVLDDSYFDGQRIGPGYDQEKTDRAYLAPTGALSLNWNSAGIVIAPGEREGRPAQVELSPASPYFVVENRVVTVASKKLRRLSVSSTPAPGGKQRIVVTGRIALGDEPMQLWKKIDNPPLYFGESLKAMLAANGVRVKGKVRVGLAPKDGAVFYVRRSDSLDLVLKRVNKNSSNFTAEQLVKTLGAQVSGAQGSWSNGLAAVEGFLAEAGIPRGTYIMKNGSGLNDANRFSASQLCTLLRAMWERSTSSPEFLSSLGIAGRDGTLAFRMSSTEAAGRLRAKTGTLENVSALSGVVETVGGEHFAFALMVNDFAQRTVGINRGLDAIGAALAELGTPGGPAAGLAKARGDAPLAAPIDELRARLTTYESLALAKDPRNAQLLRTALATTRDPALKVAIADALYRSDPEGSGARELLESFSATPEVLGRLFQGAPRGEAVEGAVEPLAPQTLGTKEAASAAAISHLPLALQSLLALSAEGDRDALNHLVGIIAAAGLDDALRRELTFPLAEVLAIAPDELLLALNGAAEAVQRPALMVLAQLIDSLPEAERAPLATALERAKGGVDPFLSALAKRIDEQVAAAASARQQGTLAGGAESPAPSPAGP